MPEGRMRSLRRRITNASRQGATQPFSAAAARASAATDLGKPLACGPGCSGCCEELVMIFRPEALRIARTGESA